MQRKVKSERRTHQIEYRGPIAIVAGKRYHDLPKRVERFQEKYAKCPDTADMPCGSIVGVVDHYGLPAHERINRRCGTITLIVGQ